MGIFTSVQSSSVLQKFFLSEIKTFVVILGPIIEREVCVVPALEDQTSAVYSPGNFESVR